MKETIDERLRKIFNKTKGHCAYCGIKLEYFTVRKTWMSKQPKEIRAWEVDHVLPKIRGGTDEINNLLPCCHKCNLRKRNRTFEEFKDWVKDKMKIQLNEIMENFNLLEETSYEYQVDDCIDTIYDDFWNTIDQIEIRFYIESIQNGSKRRRRRIMND